MSDLTIATYDKVAVEYDKLCDELYYEKELVAFADGLPTGAKILDAGCGNGMACRYLSDRGFKVTGLDASLRMVNIAAQKAPAADFVCADVRAKLFPRESFDAIFSYALFIHLSQTDCEKVWRGFYDFLKPDGVFFINVMEEKIPNEELLVDESLNPIYKTWFRFFNKKKLTEKLAEIGFVIDSVTDRVLDDEAFKDDVAFGRNEFSVFAVKKI